MRRLIATTLALVFCAVPAAQAHGGGYLHLREATAFAKHVAAKTNGVVVLSPCVRTSSRSASCKMTQHVKLDGIVCRYVVHVRKWYAGRVLHWRATTGRGDCEYVG